METNKQHIDDALRAAYNCLRLREKTDWEALAAECQCSKRHVQGLASLKERKGFKRSIAEKLAAHFGLSYSQFLSLGEWVLAGKQVTDELLLSLRTLSSRENPNLRHIDGVPLSLGWRNEGTLPPLQIRAQATCTAPEAPPVEASRSQARLDLFLADLRDELSALPTFDADDEAALRASFKSCLAELTRGK